jgi:hypothetical protein
MGSFGNDAGAFFGGSMMDSQKANWTDEQWQAVLGRDKPDNSGDVHNPNIVDLDKPHVAPYNPNDTFGTESLRNEDLSELPDDTPHEEVIDALGGSKALNWEAKTFDELRAENNALNPAALETLAQKWTGHGNDLKTKSELFKKSIDEAIAGKWEGVSASAAEDATQHLTRTSIYDFTPSSQALANRLRILKQAFDHIKGRFPDLKEPVIEPDLAHDGREQFGAHNKAELDRVVEKFNNQRFYWDDMGRLRLSGSDQYVRPEDVMDDIKRINNSTRYYEEAVQLFRDVYNPTVQAVTDNFPNLPDPPDMKFTPSGPGPGNGPGGTPPIGGGGGGTPAFNPPAFTPPGTGKNPSLPDIPGTGDPTDPSKNPINNPQIPQASPTSPVGQGLNSAMDAASKGLNSGIGAATQAAQKAAQAAGAGQKTPALREGALGLGDKPGAAKGMGGGAAGGGGGASGSGGPALSPAEPSARLSSQPTTAASPLPAASSSGTAGMGGMGAPMGGGGPAGGGKGGADGKEHKGSKALKTRKHGDDIVGDPDGVVPVLGDSESPPAEENQPAPPRRRIPQRDAPWQPDSAPQSGPSRTPQTHQPGPATADQLMDQ